MLFPSDKLVYPGHIPKGLELIFLRKECYCRKFVKDKCSKKLRRLCVEEAVNQRKWVSLFSHRRSSCLHCYQNIFYLGGAFKIRNSFVCLETFGFKIGKFEKSIMAKNSHSPKKNRPRYPESYIIDYRSRLDEHTGHQFFPTSNDLVLLIEHDQ